MIDLDLTKLLNSRYLFARRPEPNSELLFTFAILFGLILISSGLLWLYFSRRERYEPFLMRLRIRLVRWSFTTGFVGLLLIFFRWQGIPYLSSRFFLLLWLVISTVWFLTLITYLLKKFPRERTITQSHQLREKYLPRAK
ncbi:hypothetical protein HY523_02165 [Candidatus Berkelbacteria bacterium]|nr:hypothetical protein [Candidatus Berkelbacteria bacterium]